MGQGQQSLTGRHIVEQRTLLVSSMGSDHRAGNQCRSGDRLGGETSADLGHHHHHLDRTGLLGLEAESENADLGQLLPDLAAPAQFGVDSLVPTLGVVTASQHVAGGVGEHLLFVGQVKVHGRVPIFL